MTIEPANAATVPGLLNTLPWAWLFSALPTAVCLWFINAPYGRHNPGSWGPQVNARVGWLLMESPSVLIPLGVFIYVRGWESTAITVFFLIWQAHYVHRAWVYPFRLAQTSSPMPIALASFGALFNCINCGLHGAWLIVFRDSIVLDWAAPHFLPGMCLFIIGMAVNTDSCTRLLRLPALPRRNHRVVRLGAAHLEPAGANVCPLDAGQSRTEGACAPPLVPQAILRLPGQAQGAHPRTFLALSQAQTPG